MNRVERRRLQKRGSAEDLAAIGRDRIRRAARQEALEAWDRLALDIDTVILWTLHTHLGFGQRRLRAFYEALLQEHARMRLYYEMDDAYPERYKLREIGVDVAAWQREVESG